MRPTFDYIIRVIDRHLYHLYERPFINAQLNGQSQTFAEYQEIMRSNMFDEVKDDEEEEEVDNRQAHQMGQTHWQ